MAIKDPSIFIAFIEPARLILQYLMQNIEKMQDKTANYMPIGTEIVLIPSQGGAEWDIPRVIHNCRRNGILSVLCIDNWDNLTSKQVLRFKPDFVTVMGSSAINQAIAIHGLYKESLLPIGLPRFDSYRKNSVGLKSQKLNKNDFLINYLGFSIPYDEISVLNKLVQDVERFENPLIKINYRPHPARKSRRVEATPDKKLIIQESTTNLNSGTKIPNPQNYLVELTHFDLVIATPTTMAIETMALGRPCIIDATHDGVHRTSAGRAFDNYLHMQDLKTIPELKIARTYEELLEFVMEIYRSRPTAVNYSLDHLINLHPQKYIKQLIQYLPKGLD